MNVEINELNWTQTVINVPRGGLDVWGAEFYNSSKRDSNSRFRSWRYMASLLEHWSSRTQIPSNTRITVRHNRLYCYAVWSRWCVLSWRDSLGSRANIDLRADGMNTESSLSSLTPSKVNFWRICQQVIGNYYGRLRLNAFPNVCACARVRAGVWGIHRNWTIMKMFA